MKPPSVFDKGFKYTPSHDTDIRETIKRAKKRIELAKQVQEENAKEASVKVQPMRRKYGS